MSDTINIKVILGKYEVINGEPTHLPFKSWSESFNTLYTALRLLNKRYNVYDYGVYNDEESNTTMWVKVYDRKIRK
ncbi:MAG: hypothetical protein RBS91_09280 [Sulfurimonadaceae bacterium]|jgi:hypothetical protein|nr:hypothetical protein [Sulfurimonadaceae bacterium]